MSRHRPEKVSAWRAAAAEALDEHLLHCVAEFAEDRRPAPPVGEVGPDDAEVPAGQLLADGGAAGRGGADDGPAGGFWGGHGARGATAGDGTAGPVGDGGESNHGGMSGKVKDESASAPPPDGYVTPDSAIPCNPRKNWS